VPLRFGGVARNVRFGVRVSPETAAEMHEVRGVAPVSAWIDRAIREQIERERGDRGDPRPRRRRAGVKQR
jgi:hypothetical protein